MTGPQDRAGSRVQECAGRRKSTVNGPALLVTATLKIVKLLSVPSSSLAPDFAA